MEPSGEDAETEGDDHPILGATTVRYARRTRSLAAIAALAVLVPAVGATAQEDTTVTFEVTGTTGLSISTGSGSATLTEAAGVASGALPQTTVTDRRGNLLNLTWNVNVTGTDFTNAALGTVIPAGQAHVHLPTLGPSSQTRMEALLWELPVGLNRLDANSGAGYSLASGTSLLGLLGTGQVVYTPQMSVTIPSGQLGGTYTGTVTQTVSGS